MNEILAVLSPRKIDTGPCIKYENKYYLPSTQNGTKVFLRNKTSCMVIESFNKTLYVNILNQLYAMEEVPLYERFSKEFDHELIVKEKKKKYIPPMNHPWKLDNWIAFKGKQVHHINGANV